MSTQYLVGFTGTVVTGQVKVAALSAVPWSSLAPGDSVIIYDGTYTGVTTIANCVGTQANPITVTSLPGANPIIAETIDIQSSSYVNLSFLRVQNTTYSGIIIRVGSAFITVSDSVIISCPTAGVNIGSDAGVGNALRRNMIVGCSNDGIIVDGHIGTSANRTVIASNTVLNSGVHGIELRASYTLVEYNQCNNNGLLTGGTSGIHIFVATQGDGTGQNNIIRYNQCWHQNDTTLYDGNGIEADQYSGNNLICYNVCWDNDGAGIIVYNSNNNVVRNNTCYRNGRDTGNTHSAALGELIMTASSTALVAGNQVYNNLCASTKASVPGLYVDTTSSTSTSVIGPNQYSVSAGNAATRWSDSTTQTTAAAVNTATNTTGNNIDTPVFTDVTKLLAHGLRPTSKPSTLGNFPSGDTDILGLLAAAGQSNMGAYFLR